MIVCCEKIISMHTKKEMLDAKGYGLKKGKAYLVLAILLIPRDPFCLSFFLQPTGEDEEPTWYHADGFQFIDQYIPTSWIKKINDFYGKKTLKLLPQSWNYEDFFSDLCDNDPKAWALYRKEVVKMYREVGWVSRYDTQEEVESWEENDILRLAFYLGDIESSIQCIYNGVSDEEVIQCLVKIGEVCRELEQVYPRLVERYPEFPFNFAYLLRHTGTQGYQIVPGELLRSTVSMELPLLIQQLTKIYEDFQRAFDQYAAEFMQPRAKISFSLSKKDGAL